MRANTTRSTKAWTRTTGRPRRARPHSDPTIEAAWTETETSGQGVLHVVRPAVRRRTATVTACAAAHTSETETETADRWARRAWLPARGPRSGDGTGDKKEVVTAPSRPACSTETVTARCAIFETGSPATGRGTSLASGACVTTVTGAVFGPTTERRAGTETKTRGTGTRRTASRDSVAARETETGSGNGTTKRSLSVGRCFVSVFASESNASATKAATGTGTAETPAGTDATWTSRRSRPQPHPTPDSSKARRAPRRQQQQQ
mmetsp:Transcript_21849/g.53543  ORF Transcript_21849/g.53543 Transcript_21849/m.53543 type:complete len:263 (-) Transcript_21849:349-1137(-)